MADHSIRVVTPGSWGAAMTRFFRFIAHCIRLRSLSLARWVDAYESHKTWHGK